MKILNVVSEILCFLSILLFIASGFLVLAAITLVDSLAFWLFVGSGVLGFILNSAAIKIGEYQVAIEKIKWEEEHKEEIEENERKRIQEKIEQKERIRSINEDTKKEYNYFVNSVEEKNGMTIDEIKKLHWQSPKISHSQIINVKNGFCPTCGASLVNGTCEYCGNHYEDKDDVMILIYDDLLYGAKKYTFNNGKLVHIETKAKPLAQFLLKI